MTEWPAFVVRSPDAAFLNSILSLCRVRLGRFGFLTIEDLLLRHEDTDTGQVVSRERHAAILTINGEDKYQTRRKFRLVNVAMSLIMAFVCYCCIDSPKRVSNESATTAVKRRAKIVRPLSLQ
jgi:hypothetical protein